MGEQEDQVEQDYLNYKVLLDLWSKENPIKTTKLQMLLAVNGLLASAVNISGGKIASFRTNNGWMVCSHAP